MKTLPALVTTLFFCAALSAANETPQALQDAFMTALRNNDVDGLASCYAPDAVNFPIDAMIGTGPASARRSWSTFFEAYRVKRAELSEDQLIVRDDIAVAWGLFTIWAEPRSGGDPVEMSGRYMDVARSFDGDWLYIADHASVPVPGE